MIFQCNRCLKYFDTKYHYNKHLGRKIQCKEIIIEKLDEDVNDKIEVIERFQMIPNGFQMETNGNENDSIFQCLICNKIYKNRSGLFKHKKHKHPNYENDIQIIQNSQKEDPEIEENEIKQVKKILIEQAKQIENLNNKNKELELLVKTSKTSKTKTNKIINNISNTNNGQIINNNFNIVSFGDEDIRRLTQEEILSVLKSRNGALFNLIKMVHLNERLPEFHNVLINNIKSKYGSIVDDNKIILRKKDKIIADIISNRLVDLKDLVNEYNNEDEIFFRNTIKIVIIDNIYDVLKHGLIENNIEFNKIN
jgi:hypothetical protein